MHRSTRNVFVYLYLIMGLAHVIAHFAHIQWLQVGSKPLLMPLLLLWYFFNSRDKIAPEFTLTVTALVLSWLGDIFLMFTGKGEQFFIIGLSSFLLAHLFYIADFRYLRLPAPGEKSKGFINIRIIVLVLAGSSLFFMLRPQLGPMLWPVGLYTMVIIGMAISALLRKGHTNEVSFISIYAGALVFILSDSMIAITKFLTPIEQSPAIIMVTYIMAQFFIVRGVVYHNDPVPLKS